MDRYVEKKRERRFRSRRRAVRRAYRMTREWWPGPDEPYSISPDTWEEVFDRRWRDARRFADHQKFCACTRGCRNGRRMWGDPTLQEYRESVAAVIQLVEVGLADDHVRWMRTMKRRPRI